MQLNLLHLFWEVSVIQIPTWYDWIGIIAKLDLHLHCKKSCCYIEFAHSICIFHVLDFFIDDKKTCTAGLMSLNKTNKFVT